MAALLLPPPPLPTPGAIVVVVAYANGAPSVHVDMPTPPGPIVSVWPPMTVVKAVDAPSPTWNVLPLISTAVRPICVTVAPPTTTYLVAEGAAAAAAPSTVSPWTMTPVGAIRIVSPSMMVVMVLLPESLCPYVMVVPSMTTLSVPMAVISSPPSTAVCVGPDPNPDPAAACKVWLGKTIPVGPSVIV